MAMGEDEDILSATSSSFNKPSSSVNDTDEVKNLISVSPENTPKQCEFIQEVDKANESPLDPKEDEDVPLVDKVETHAPSLTASDGGIIGAEAISGEATVLETKVGDVAVEVEDKLLSESRNSLVGLVQEGGSSLSKSGLSVVEPEVAEDKPVAGNEIPICTTRGDTVSCVGDQLLDGVGLEVSTEGVSAGEQEVAPTADGNENASDTDAPEPVVAETSEGDDDVVSCGLGSGSGSGSAEGESYGSEVKTLHLSGEEPTTNLEIAKEVAVTQDSSAVVMETEKACSAIGDLEKSALDLDNNVGAQPFEDKDLIEETSESKMGIETAAQVADVTEMESDHASLEVSQLVGSEPPVMGMQEKGKNMSSDPKIENEISRNLESSNVQFDASEIAAKSEENREMMGAVGSPTGDTEAELETATELENIADSDGESAPNLDDPLVLPQDEDDDEIAAEEGTALADTEMETEIDVPDSGKSGGGKRKRGKNSKIPGTKTTSRSGKMMDEDVCFICFDGGDLVLCDRRGCPKAYHPSCVNRDEAFFRSKGRWNCGWHICSKCEKNASYMCYTCTFSLCKGCIKNAVIFCVRGNKGFCETCMRTVKQIENSNLSHKDGQVDFDDRSSWEFLFKDYYTDLKSKLSLTKVEISEAKNPCKGSSLSAGKEDSPEALVGVSNGGGSGSENSTENPEASKPKRRKANKRLRSLVKEKGLDGVAASVGSEGISVSTPGSAEWASKELLDFVMHMKNGDKSVLSQFDVQALLLEYIKRNKLRDPRKKSQIICDSRLQNLFGKPRVGHFEMLKLLESHFLAKEDSHNDDVQGSVVDTEVNHFEANENADTPPKEIKDKKRKVRKKGDGRGSQSDRYEYAAIDMHNISLIYLRRKLMEDLLEDGDEFQNKVVGTFVRIRISGNTQKQDLYRLVQVVGTSKAAEPYKVGKRTTDMMLEISNLNKKEAVSIDTISNQDFTEEECKRLRQSIKFGLLNRMTVGDILDKAMEIQVARVNDWLESETLRLGHLRDRASDMGRRKELRECVEKLEILKTPEERLRRLEEVPRVHADPNMDPSHESDEHDSETDDNKRDVFARSRSSGFSRRGRAPISPGSDFSSKDSWNVGKTSGKNWELEANFSSKSSLNSVEDVIQSDEMTKENVWNQGIERETPELDAFDKFNTFSKTDKVGWTNQSVARSESNSGIMMSSSASTSAKEVLSAAGLVNSSAKETETTVKANETQKMWHYQDPSGKVQGPFSMVQLRKWSNTGYFPANLKIWKTSEKQDESILLTDALAGRFQKGVPTGDGVIPLSGGLQSAHVLSGLSGKISEISLQLQQQAREVQNIDQNPGAKTSRQIVSKGLMDPSVEAVKLSSEKWTRGDSLGLPSPTPKLSNAGGNGEGVPLITATLHPDGIPSATAAFSEQGNLSSVPAHTEHLTRSLEISRTANIENTGNGSRISLLISSTKPGDPQHAIERHSHLPQDNLVIPTQSIPSQNLHVETHGWAGQSTQKVEPNSSVPVSGQAQAYSTWGPVTPTIQNSAGSFPDSTASSMPQPEFWRPPVQGNQPNMQPVGAPNLAWGPGMMENNPSTTALRPENPNPGWATMQGTPNAGWGGPVSGATNMNWGATVQGPAPGGANSGWAMAPVNMGGTTIQGPMPGTVNPGWVAPTGNPGSQGLGPGVANTNWVAPAGNMGSAVVPGPGNGWMVPPGNPGAPVQAPPPPSGGNPTHGWGTPAGNQGLWGNEQHQSGGKFPGPKVSHGGDSAYGGGRPWNGQPSHGNGGSGGPFRHLPKRQTLCPYNINGRCKKGAACDYLHA